VVGILDIGIDRTRTEKTQTQLVLEKMLAKDWRLIQALWATFNLKVLGAPNINIDTRFFMSVPQILGLSPKVSLMFLRAISAWSALHFHGDRRTS
jgi:hypothetical protein